MSLSNSKQEASSDASTSIPSNPEKKPRVLVLGIESGHWKGPISDMVGKKCEVLDFKLLTDGIKPFPEYDRVVLTKKVIPAWKDKAKAVISGDRLIIAPGGPEQISQAISEAISGSSS
jgi:hypothetical protein